MLLIDRLAEERIQQSIKRGDLDDLPGIGQPLELDDDSLVPVDMRAAYRLLKNSGFMPPEIQWRREIADIESLLAQTVDQGECQRARKRLLLLRLKLEQTSSCTSQLWLELGYRDRLLDKLSGG